MINEAFAFIKNLNNVGDYTDEAIEGIAIAIKASGTSNTHSFNSRNY